MDPPAVAVASYFLNAVTFRWSAPPGAVEHVRSHIAVPLPCADISAPALLEAIRAQLPGVDRLYVDFRASIASTECIVLAQPRPTGYPFMLYPLKVGEIVTEEKSFRNGTVYERGPFVIYCSLK
jgi:hypothetical protein